MGSRLRRTLVQSIVAMKKRSSRVSWFWVELVLPLLGGGYNMAAFHTATSIKYKIATMAGGNSACAAINQNTGSKSNSTAVGNLNQFSQRSSSCPKRWKRRTEDSFGASRSGNTMSAAFLALPSESFPVFLVLNFARRCLRRKELLLSKESKANCLVNNNRMSRQKPQPGIPFGRQNDPLCRLCDYFSKPGNTRHHM
mgnify:CR=1 FL=1